MIQNGSDGPFLTALPILFFVTTTLPIHVNTLFLISSEKSNTIDIFSIIYLICKHRHDQIWAKKTNVNRDIFFKG